MPPQSNPNFAYARVSFLSCLVKPLGGFQNLLNLLATSRFAVRDTREGKYVFVCLYGLDRGVGMPK